MRISNEDAKKFLQELSFVQQILPPDVTVSEFIARGGQGVVYRGMVSGQDAAVKIYYPGQTERRRIDREIDALEVLDCENIVQLLWHGLVSVTDFQQFYVVATDFIEGEALNQKLDVNPLTFEELGILAYDVTIAIRAMWKPPDRIVHRDLKPQNIMFMPNNRACVIDLGVARHIDQTTLTTFGNTYGTRGYMSPEQCKFQKQLTYKSDIYALGVILVESALGHHPSRRDQSDLLSMDLHENLPPKIYYWDHAPLLRRMLHPRSTVRPKPSEILEELNGSSP